MNQNYDLTVFIGRFQPFHNGHLHVINEALKQSKHVCILVGSSNEPRSIRNPFTFAERVSMIHGAINVSEPIYIKPLEDILYNDSQWVKNIQESVDELVKSLKLVNPKIALIGHSKDATSYYLKLFPQWGNINVENFHNFSSTPIRNMYFSNIGDIFLNDIDGHKIGDLPQEKILPPNVRKQLLQFIETPDYNYIRDEYEFVLNYKSQWNSLPYKVIFTTTDACVIQSGHVLLVKRKGRPGKGLWALPGGFMGYDETVVDSMLRELKEETKIDVSYNLLRSSIVTSQVFDDPNRSARGRTITHGFLIHLRPDRDLPKIKRKLPTVEGADDAEKAIWMPLSKLTRSMFFEDHYSMIQKLIGYL